MKKVLITGANSFVGMNIERWLMKTPEEFSVDTVDTMNDVWKQADFSKYDAVFNVAGIAHVDPKPEMAPLYYKVNRDLAIEIAKWAKDHGVKQYIYMSSKIVYHASKSLKGDVVTKNTTPNPNDFYGDSKLQAENGLKELETDTFKICILRPPMIYGPNNKRSMLHVDNLAEFVKQLILRDMSGTFFPQNSEYADTVELVRYFADKNNKKVWITGLLNPFVWLGGFFLKPVCKMFSSSYYEQDMSQYGFNYQVVSDKDSLEDVEAKKTMR